MSLELDIDKIVERLETFWMPQLSAFGKSLMKSNDGIVAETFSHRHADCIHNFGLSCHPAGTDLLDPRNVSLIVTVILRTGFTLKAYVAWQSPSFHQEGETSVHNAFGESDCARFNEELPGLLDVLAKAIARGAPPHTQANYTRSDRSEASEMRRRAQVMMWVCTIAAAIVLAIVGLLIHFAPKTP